MYVRMKCDGKWRVRYKNDRSGNDERHKNGDGGVSGRRDAVAGEFCQVTHVLRLDIKRTGILQPAVHIKPPSSELHWITTRMFVNGVDAISKGLDNINLNYTTMQPKPERPPLCPKTKLPMLHLTPSEKKGDGSPHQSTDDPWLLKPHHDIPPTPPPQTEPVQMYPDRTG